MPTPDAVKRQIETAEDLQSVVKTMKALAAVSMRQYEQAVASLGAYNRTIEMALQVTLRDTPALMDKTGTAPNGNFGVLVLGSDQGLCGRFNDQIVDAALSIIQGVEPEAERWHVVAVGARAAARLEEMGQPVADTLTMPASLAGVTPMVQDVLIYLDTWRVNQRLGRMVLLHNRLVSGSVYTPHTVHLLPFDGTRLNDLTAPSWPSRSLPTFTLDREQLLSSLLRQHLFVSLYRSLVESLASENASRLASMQAAERSIEERLDDLRTQFRYQRQHAITEELLDIVAGFEALSDA
jgi:F-type H+-transporting ATPase subunit gamma